MKLIKNIFSDIEYSNLYPKGTKPARLIWKNRLYSNNMTSDLGNTD